MDPSSGTTKFSKVRAWLHRDAETDMEMTVLTTSGGRVVTSPRHSLATDHGEYKFATIIDVGDTLWNRNGSRMIVHDKRREVAKGLYSPLTETSNYFAGESESSMVLAHNFAHLWRPQLFSSTVHRILDMAELVWPRIHELKGNDKRYIHPIMKRLAPLFGIELGASRQLLSQR